MLIAKIAWRNLLRQRRRSLLTGLTMAGGYALLCLSIGIADGSYSHVINAFTRSYTGHLQVMRRGTLEQPKVSRAIADPAPVVQMLEQDADVVLHTSRVVGSALAYVGSRSAPAEVVGIDREGEVAATQIDRRVQVGRFLRAPEDPEAPSEALVDAGIANTLGLELGAELVLISQGADGSVANDLYTVVGFLGTPEEGGRRVYLDLKAAQQLFVLGERVHHIVAILRGHQAARTVSARLDASLASTDLVAHPWQTLEADFFRTMEMDYKGNYVALGVVVLLVAIAILTTVLMTILERTREYGVLKAVGTRGTLLVRMIVLEMGFLALLSSVAGIALALPVLWYFMEQGIALPEPVEMGGMVMERMLAEVSLRVLGLPLVVICGTAVVVSAFPAWRAAWLSPLDALRGHG